jgi:hypothetical protein
MSFVVMSLDVLRSNRYAMNTWSLFAVIFEACDSA